VIVLDGRTDAEKLGELLTETEQTHLDFKEMVDLRAKKDELNLIKDIVTMSNRPGGGYILIGVSDDGVPCCTAGTIPRRDFDGANIGQKVRVFVESDVQVITAIHEADGNEVVVIHAQPHSDGLPVPMAKTWSVPGRRGKTSGCLPAGRSLRPRGVGQRSDPSLPLEGCPQPPRPAHP
jgi:predicted HTH transcriptional regulator